MPKNGSTTVSSRRRTDAAPLIPLLARRVREVEARASRGKLGPTNRTRFQVIAMLVRDERSRIRADESLSGGARSELLKRLDGIATILARTATRDTSVLNLLDPEAEPSRAAQEMRNEWLESVGIELTEEQKRIKDVLPKRVISASIAEKQVVPASVTQRLREVAFQAPVFTHNSDNGSGPLAGWELLDPLYRAFEEGAGGGSATMPLPPFPPIDQYSPQDRELMRHQVRFLESVKAGHRQFLLADEPGLGKTAQSVVAASIAQAYPLLVVVPNVVKINWSREVELWTPGRTVTVIHGDGDDMDAFADVFVINYEILDRHLGWMSDFGFKGMVVDEAHFIKNLTSQRSQNVLTLAEQIRSEVADPLLIALTGTPLINEVEDFHAIWRFLGWIDEDGPRWELREKLEEIGVTPADRKFYPAARRAVIDLGIVRRLKTDVAKDLPARRVADMPVELDDELGRSIREAESELGRRLAQKYRALMEHQGRSVDTDSDLELMRIVAQRELESSKNTKSGENVFTMVRKIGQAKATLAADYTVQLVRSVGKVVFFAKHIDVMDTAETHFADAGLKSVSIRGEQSATARQNAIDAFTGDPDVSVAVCSLTAAGVGLNLHAASNVVLAELSWTAAEQAQAIDRVHRIGQEQPVTAWRILAAHTIDTKIAELIDSKEGLAARALDGSDADIVDTSTVQVDALVHLLQEALELDA